MITERKRLSDVYRIEDGIIYYNCVDKHTYSREVCQEIVDLLTKKRKVRLGSEKKSRVLTFLLENEMRSINRYILGWDKEFELIPARGKEELRGFGSIEITVNKKRVYEDTINQTTRWRVRS